MEWEVSQAVRIVCLDQLWKEVSFLKDKCVPHLHISDLELTALDRVNFIQITATILAPTKVLRSTFLLAMTRRYITIHMLLHWISILISSRIHLSSTLWHSCKTKGALWK